MPLILGTNSIKDTGFNVANSCRFDGSSGFSKSSVAGTRTKATFSAWIKRGTLSGEHHIFFSRIDVNNQAFIRFTSSQQIEIFNRTSGSNTVNYITNSVYRDPSAWMHILVVLDTTQGTAGNRVKLFVNGTQVTSFGTETQPSQNSDLAYNTTSDTYYVGTEIATGSNYFNGYMAEVVYQDGVAGSTTDYGEFDEDSSIWKPIDVSGLTFGNSGFYLDFEDSGNLGNDVNGGTDLTENGIVATDQSTDTCTNNFATLNPLTIQQTAGYILSEGNLRITIGGTNERKAVLGTIGLTSGKWYWEVNFISTTGHSLAQIGISDVIQDAEASTENGKMGYFPYDYGYRGENGGKKTNNGTYTNYGDSWTAGDTIGVAVDLDNNAIYFSKNGTFQASGNPETGANPTFSITDPASTGTGAYFPAIGKEASETPVFEFNFGSPSYTISSGNSDGNGYGNFEYSVPSGYYAINTKNLAEYG